MSGTVYLNWAPSRYPHLKGYSVYRNVKGEVTPELLNDFLVAETTFVDRIFNPDIPLENDASNPDSYAFEYHVKSIDQDLNQSAKYSPGILVEAALPTLVRTTQHWEIQGAIDGRAGIDDTLTFIVQFENPTRGQESIAWFIDGTFRKERELKGSPRAGGDTLKAAFSYFRKYEVRCDIRDAAGTLWSESASLDVVADDPVADAGADTVVDEGMAVIFRPKASQKFGKVVRYEWDVDGDSVYDYSTDSDEPVTHVYS